MLLREMNRKRERESQFKRTFNVAFVLLSTSKYRLETMPALAYSAKLR